MARRDDQPDDPADRGPRGDRGEPVDVVIAQPGEVERAGEPPVVARLVVEIRSDGKVTIARGALEDSSTGRGVAIEASGRTPLQLALSLARSLVTLPAFGRSAARALLRGPRGPRGGGDGGSNRGGRRGSES